MYIKNFYSNSKSQIQPTSKTDFELIKVEKKEDYSKLILKLYNSIYKVIIIPEKQSMKFYVYDGFNNMNVFEVYSSFEELDSRVEDVSYIIKEGNYYFVVSPLSGRIEKINDQVSPGDQIVIISAMKMEHSIIADKYYQVVEKFAEIGQFVDINQKIIKLKEIQKIEGKQDSEVNSINDKNEEDTY
ncbi:MAG: acetyl-CoA carboxylase biotin carboxyl carrier protein subunit [bacterium]